jgi:hypothetical protein
MHAELQASVAFHLTGQRAGEGLEALAGSDLRPALLARYRDLTSLRYDFPLVLLRDAPDEALVEPLTRLMNRALEKTASGTQGERLRACALKLERQLRAIAATGGTGTLGAALDEGARRLATSADPALEEGLAKLRAALPLDGELIDCGKETPARVLEHVWRAAQRRKTDAFRKQADRLVLRLREILMADRAHAESARTPQQLKAAVGATHGGDFDFDALARVLARVPPGGTLTERRRRRIEATLATLASQRFFHASGETGALEFRFDDCAAALAAFRERIPEMARLAHAITIAKLEIDGEYSEPRHDALFERLAAAGLDLRELAFFPDYLVCAKASDLRAAEHGELMEILASGLPMKVLVQSDDILEPPLVDTGHLAFGARSRRFANMAIGLRDIYVMQTSASNLPRLRDRVVQAMNYPGPALFSVFSGATGHSGGLPPYLVAAAAMESRAFPAFTYDPGAGADWAARFCVAENPQAERDWPLHELSYEDAEHQRTVEKIAFSLLDFIACDRRYAGHFARVPRASGTETLAPAVDCLSSEAKGMPEQLPMLIMVDGDDRLQKVIVDQRLIGEARRCRDLWHSLQELGGIHNSHAEKLLARERQRWEETLKKAAAAPAPAADSSAPPPAPPAATVPAPEAEPQRSSDEPYIETPRCSSCDECIQINNRMFAYDENKQARIVDPAAGTYRQLVEAAESCQVAIIHPGKPKHPDEPGLDELLKRAEAFA